MSNREVSIIQKVLVHSSALQQLITTLESFSLGFSNSMILMPVESSSSLLIKEVSLSKEEYLEQCLQSDRYGPITRLELGLQLFELKELGNFAMMTAMLSRVIQQLTLSCSNRQEWEEMIKICANSLGLSKEGEAMRSIPEEVPSIDSKVWRLLESQSHPTIQAMGHLLQAIDVLQLQNIADMSLPFNGEQVKTILPDLRGPQFGEVFH